ncbi:hypothetical protein ATHL_00749 [Anaerolinea thermolimosa]|uniref:hypothetical protein n=1 Tax=Anaerolinea thermolimosa TaxID=229919 RepID=UPI00078365DC|nr:hypothetical protein [Anaerolinea thermolimosa]GAP05908.1 hypothetical protein ATHL_00749 [Anaerolinea thermolimosa]
MTGIQDNRKPAAGTAGQGNGARQSVRQTYYSSDGKLVASLCGTVLRKRVRASVHQLRQPPAWAVDADILRKAMADGAQVVEIEDTETGRVFVTGIRAFELCGFCFNRGFGEQVALPLKFWRVEVVDARQPSLFEV